MSRSERTPYKSPKWKAIRKMVLFNPDGSRKRCEIAGPGCKGEATQADHIVPWRDGGAWFALENLRPACAHCNNSAGANHKNANGWRRRRDLHLTVYVGPIAEIGEHVIVDRDTTVLSLDRLIDTFGHNKAGRAMANAAWNRVLFELRRGDIEAGYVIVHANTTRDAETLPGDDLVGPGLEVITHAGNENFGAVESGRW